MSNEQSPQIVVVQSRGNSLGIVSFILGLVAFLFCWVPFLGALSIPLSGLGLLLGLIGLLVAMFRKGAGMGWVIGGLVVSILALVVAFSVTKATADALEKVGSGTSQESTEKK